MLTQKQLADRQLFWEAFKATAAIIGTAALLFGTVGLANWLRPSPQPMMFPPGTTITIPPQVKQ
jgi:hypothetical protein